MKSVFAKYFLVVSLCIINASKIHGPLDILIILDESGSFRNLHTERMKNVTSEIGGHKHYDKMIQLVNDIFEIGPEQVRVAMVCTGHAYPEFQLTTMINYICKAGKDYAENLHESFNVAKNMLTGDYSRRNVEKAVLVFTDGYLEPNEAVFPTKADSIRKDGKLFFFHLKKPGDKNLNKEAMVNIAKNEKNIIYFDVNDVSKTIKLFQNTICGYDQNSEQTCKAVPGHETHKCQRNVTNMPGGCYNVSMVECNEMQCHCDDMYLWSGAQCSVTCGGGVKRRLVQSKSVCKVDGDYCNNQPCPVTEITIQASSDKEDAQLETGVESDNNGNSTVNVFNETGQTWLIIKAEGSTSVPRYGFIRSIAVLILIFQTI